MGEREKSGRRRRTNCLARRRGRSYTGGIGGKRTCQVESGRIMVSFNPHLTNVVCWTRMHAEAGQDIESIIARKELERRAGGGLFFWGIGNAPSRSVGRLAARGEDVDVVFSLMKSRPAARDVAPPGVVAWRTYFDYDEIERPLPPHVLVTSRMESGTGTKTVHYALMCWSAEELRLEDRGAFDSSAYRNVSDAGGPVGNSQVTALVVRTRAESPVSDYRINLRAKLVGGYWVRLARPCVLGEAARAALVMVSARRGKLTAKTGSGWFRRSGSSPNRPSKDSFLFFKHLNPCGPGAQQQGVTWTLTKRRSRND